MDPTSRIYVAGGEHMIVNALLDELHRRGYAAIAGGDRTPDPTNRDAVTKFFARFRPDYVIVAGGDSGGIQKNVQHPAKLMMDNLGIATSIIPVAYECGVTKLLYLGSSCGYPKDCPQPMKESALFTGAVEPTSEAYALAKLAGIRLCQAYRREYDAPFIAAIPANEFGPGDHFDPEDAHVIAALIHRMHEAKEANADSVVIWGTGEPIRDFIFARDLAGALILILDQYDEDEPINAGSGEGCSIAEIAQAIKEAVGFQGELVFDASKPDGMPRKVLDISKLRALGWEPATPLLEAITETYRGYLNQHADSATPA